MAESAPQTMTDDELGIGVDDTPAPDALAALLADPRLAAVIEAAVAQRVAQMGSGQTVVPALDLSALTQTLGHMIEVNSMQQPGYIKPLPVEEVDRRAAGLVEMRALLREYEEKGKPPLWEVGEGGFFECANAQEYRQGQRLRMYMPPPEDFRPLNEEAEKVHAAMMQWIGGPTPGIDEQVKEAERLSHEAPLITGTMQPAKPRGPVEVVDEAAPVVTKAKRAMGSLMPERRDVSLADRGAVPVGPQFAEAV